MIDFDNKHRYEFPLRELFIWFGVVFIFPFRTIRALTWKWYFWLNKVDKEIKKDHENWLNS